MDEPSRFVRGLMGFKDLTDDPRCKQWHSCLLMYKYDLIFARLGRQWVVSRQDGNEKELMAYSPKECSFCGEKLDNGTN